MEKVAKTFEGATDTVKDATDYVSKTLQGQADQVSKEGNKVAMDSGAGAAERVKAAGGALRDKANEAGNTASAEAKKDNLTGGSR